VGSSQAACRETDFIILSMIKPLGVADISGESFIKENDFPTWAKSSVQRTGLLRKKSA
jgi:hypothetical protein